MQNLENWVWICAIDCKKKCSTELHFQFGIFPLFEVFSYPHWMEENQP